MMGWSLVPGDPSPAPLASAGGVPSQGWAANGVQSFGANSAATAFGPISTHAPSNQVAIVPDANGLLPGQTKFYTPPPVVGQTVDASMNPLPNAPTLQLSRAALTAVQAAPANAIIHSAPGNNGQSSAGGAFANAGTAFSGSAGSRGALGAGGIGGNAGGDRGAGTQGSPGGSPGGGLGGGFRL